MGEVLISITLPLPLTLHGYSAEPLPSCWNDLILRRNTSENVWGEAFGDPPRRIVTFEFYASRNADARVRYHFQAQFYENMPGVVRYNYFDGMPTRN